MSEIFSRAKKEGVAASALPFFRRIQFNLMGLREGREGVDEAKSVQ